MLLSGNVASERFVMMSAEDVRREVREAIRDGAPGGGFTLKPSGSGPGIAGYAMSPEQQDRMIENSLQRSPAKNAATSLRK